MNVNVNSNSKTTILIKSQKLNIENVRERRVMIY